MKTLKQQIRETILNQNYPIENLEELEDDILKEIKKWLIQKRQEYTDDLDYPLGQRVLIGTFVSNILDLFGDNK